MTGLPYSRSLLPLLASLAVLTFSPAHADDIVIRDLAWPGHHDPAPRR